jgi:acyl-CoA hydrolase
MEVTVNVFAENIKSGKTILTNKAFITFVALDDAGKPVPVPPIIPETEEEKINFSQAEVRRQERLKKKSIEENNGLTP